MCRVDKFGFPRTAAKFGSVLHGFRMGDLVCAKVPFGKYRGAYYGRLASIRARGGFDVAINNLKFTTNHKNLTHRQRADGFAYAARQDLKKSTSLCYATTPMAKF